MSDQVPRRLQADALMRVRAAGVRTTTSRPMELGMMNMPTSSDSERSRSRSRSSSIPQTSTASYGRHFGSSQPMFGSISQSPSGSPDEEGLTQRSGPSGSGVSSDAYAHTRGMVLPPPPRGPSAGGRGIHITPDQAKWVSKVKARLSRGGSAERAGKTSHSRSRSRSRSSSGPLAVGMGGMRGIIKTSQGVGGTPRRGGEGSGGNRVGTGLVAASTLMPPPTTSLKRKRGGRLGGKTLREEEAADLRTFVTPRAPRAVPVTRTWGPGSGLGLPVSAGEGERLIRMARVQAMGKTVKELDVVMTLVRKTIEQLRMEGAAFPEYTRFQAELENECHALVQQMEQLRILERGTSNIVDQKNVLREEILHQKRLIGAAEAVIAEKEKRLSSLRSQVNAAESSHDFVSRLSNLIRNASSDSNPASSTSSTSASHAHHTNLQQDLITAAAAADSTDRLRSINDSLQGVLDSLNLVSLQQ